MQAAELYFRFTALKWQMARGGIQGSAEETEETEDAKTRIKIIFPKTAKPNGNAALWYIYM